MNAVSLRAKSLISKLGRKKYREAYLSQHLRMFLATQIRALRGGLSQIAFGKLLGKPQSVVSRLESADYGKVTLQTLIDIANKLDVALVVRFVSYPLFLRTTEDFSEAALKPKPYRQDDMDALLRAPAGYARNSALMALFEASESPQQLLFEGSKSRQHLVASVAMIAASESILRSSAAEASTVH